MIYSFRVPRSTFLFDFVVDTAQTPSQRIIEQALRIADDDDVTFIVVDLSGIYAHQNPQDLTLEEGSHHSNPRAHALIADALYHQLMTDPRIDLVNRARRAALGAAGASLTTQP